MCFVSDCASTAGLEILSLATFNSECAAIQALRLGNYLRHYMVCYSLNLKLVH